MSDAISLAALKTLSDLKRTGVIPTVRPCCGQSYCVCEHAPHVPSLRDYAADHAKYDRAIEPMRLRVVTAGGPPAGPPCDGTLVCSCERCEIERQAAVKRQRRARIRQPWETAA